MRINTTPFALLALPALTYAVSLNDFVPRVEKVSSDCRKVYQQNIPDCSESDFTGKECSDSCVRGLSSMTGSVKSACGGEGILEQSDRENQNVLAAFLGDNGPQSLCKNAAAVLAESPSSSAPAPTSSQEPSTTPSPTPTSSPSAASSVVDSTVTAPTSYSDVPTSLAIDTSSSPAPTGAETSTSATEENSSAATSQSSQIFDAPSMPPSLTSSASGSEQTGDAGHSGGGSPFDAAGNEFNGSAANTATSVATVAIAAMLTAMVCW